MIVFANFIRLLYAPAAVHHIHDVITTVTAKSLMSCDPSPIVLGGRDASL